MNREIKFRAWDIKRRRMIDLHKITPLALVSGINESGKGLYLPLGESGTNLIFEQFTGLKDKNGVEIYEGDKIDGNLFDYRLPTTGTAVYDNEHGCWANKNDAGLTFLFKIDQIEVIGNIHDEENPNPRPEQAGE